MISKRPPIVRARFRLIAVLLLAGVLVALGIWQFYAPAGMRLACTYACRPTQFFSLPMFESCDAGFLLFDKEGVLHLFDWRTGAARWAVTPPRDWFNTPRTYSDIGSGLLFGPATSALSRNGRYLAVTFTRQQRLYAQTWCDGASTGMVQLPAAMFALITNTHCATAMSNTGRLYLVSQRPRERTSRENTPYAAVIEAGRIIAHGPCPAEGTFFADYGLFNAWGYSGSTVYTVTLHAGQLRFTEKFRASESVLQPLSADLFRGNTGRMLFSSSGRMLVPDWASNPMEDVGSAYKHDADGMCIYPGKGDTYRIFAPSGPHGWSVTPPTLTAKTPTAPPTNRIGEPSMLSVADEYDNCTLSSSGEYALVVQEVMHPQTSPWAKLQGISSVGTYFNLYQRPGHLRARLYEPEVHHPTTSTYSNLQRDNFTATLSPDGHAMLCGPYVRIDTERGYTMSNDYKLYRW